MADLQKRLAELTPAQRQALTKLLKNRAEAHAPGQERSVSNASAATRPTHVVSSRDAELILDNSSPSEPDALKASYKRFYDTVSSQLNSTVFGQFSYFLNYGYVTGGEPEYSQVSLPEQYINRNSVKLVLEVIGDCLVDDKRVLDVGCGRGGTIHTLLTFFKPAAVTGLDLSTAAIQFCKQAHKASNVRFFEGDAEQLPFEDGAFDVVTNLESSHSYPHIHRFYSEVYRVLPSGGYFLYTDTLTVQQMNNCIAYLQHIGFQVERDRDITRNVLLSCQQIANTRVQAFDPRNDQQLMQNFLATPGSNVYEEMRSGRWVYRILKLRKLT
jgi:phthiocerol/phenolphthiocerol synthesis type-I polyketide synthase E